MRWVIVLAAAMAGVAGCSGSSEVAVGGKGFGAERFTGRGELIRDHDLFDRAKRAWGRTHAFDGGARALWAGRLPEGDTVILQDRGAAAGVQFTRQDPDGHVVKGELFDRFVVTGFGVLLDPSLPATWHVTSLDFRTAAALGARVTTVRARDGFAPFALNEYFLGFSPARVAGRGPVSAVVGSRAGGRAAISVDRGAWRAFEARLTDGYDAVATAAAASVAAGALSANHETARHVRLLRAGDSGVAVSAYLRGRTAIAFGTGSAEDPVAKLLSEGSRRPALGAATLRVSRSRWLVAAGERSVRQIEVDSVVRQGNFALVDPAPRRPRVRGFLADGSVVRAGG